MWRSVNRWKGRGLMERSRINRDISINLPSQCDMPVYFWPCGCYLLYNAIITQKRRKKITLSQSMTKPTKWLVYPANSDQLGHPPSLLNVFACALRIAKDPRFLHVDSEDSDQLIWVFAGCTVNFVGFVMLWLTFVFLPSKEICYLVYFVNSHRNYYAYSIYWNLHFVNIFCCKTKLYAPFCLFT